MSKDNEIGFCQRCGHALDDMTIHGVRRHYCPSCGRVSFLDPKIAVVVLVTMDNNLVLVRRDIEPAIGQWSFPSGYVDRYEMVEDAAVREVKEETGLEVEIDGWIGLYSRRGDCVVLAVYSAHVIGGHIRSGLEVRETKMFDPVKLPALPFPHDDDIIRDWHAQRPSPH